MTAEAVTIAHDGTDGEKPNSTSALRRTDLSPVAEAGGAASKIWSTASSASRTACS
jgi:hypothetical protein